MYVCRLPQFLCWSFGYNCMTIKLQASSLNIMKYYKLLTSTVVTISHVIVYDDLNLQLSTFAEIRSKWWLNLQSPETSRDVLEKGFGPPQNLHRQRLLKNQTTITYSLRSAHLDWSRITFHFTCKRVLIRVLPKARGYISSHASADHGHFGRGGRWLYYLLVSTRLLKPVGSSEGLRCTGPEEPDAISSLVMEGDAIFAASGVYVVKYLRGKEVCVFDVLEFHQQLYNRSLELQILLEPHWLLRSYSDLSCLPWPRMVVECLYGTLQATVRVARRMVPHESHFTLEPLFSCAIQFDIGFTAVSLLHPATYLNKVLVASSEGDLQLWNIRTQWVSWSVYLYHWFTYWF